MLEVADVQLTYFNPGSSSAMQALRVRITLESPSPTVCLAVSSLGGVNVTQAQAGDDVKSGLA